MKRKLLLALTILMFISGCASSTPKNDKVYTMVDEGVIEKIKEKGIEVEFDLDGKAILTNLGVVNFSLLNDEHYDKDVKSHIMNFDVFIESLDVDDFNYEDYRIEDLDVDKEVDVDENEEVEIDEKDESNKVDKGNKVDKDKGKDKGKDKDKGNSGKNDKNPGKDSTSTPNKPVGGSKPGNDTGDVKPIPKPEPKPNQKPTPKPEPKPDPKPATPKPENGRWVKMSEEVERIPFKKVSVKNPSVDVGVEYVSQVGVNGAKEHIKYCWEVEGIKDFNNCKVESRVAKTPTDEITQIGTKVAQPDRIEYKYSDSGYNTKLMNLVNNHRVVNGSAPMAWDQEAQNLIKGRIQVLIDYMNKHQTLPDNHEGNLFHENISFTRASSTPERFFEMYKGSPGHNQSMLASVFERFSGISVTKYVNGRPEYTINVIQFR